MYIYVFGFSGKHGVQVNVNFILPHSSPGSPPFCLTPLICTRLLNPISQHHHSSTQGCSLLQIPASRGNQPRLAGGGLYNHRGEFPRVCFVTAMACVAWSADTELSEREWANGAFSFLARLDADKLRCLGVGFGQSLPPHLHPRARHATMISSVEGRRSSLVGWNDVNCKPPI